MRISFVLCTVLYLALFGLAQERRYTGTLPPQSKTTKGRPRGRIADRFRQPTPPTLPPDFTPPTPPKAERLTPPTPPTPPTAPTVPLALPVPVTQPAVQKKLRSTVATPVPQSLQEPEEDYEVVDPNVPTQDPRLTGDPQKDYKYDPNLPRELNGFDLSNYPFYTAVPEDITFDCANRHDGYYASIPHFCQLFHYCVTGMRYDFLCANYTLFDQTTFTCRFVNTVNCPASESHYERNNELYKPTTTTTLRPPRRRTKTPPPQEYDDEYDEYDEEYYDEDATTTTTTRRPRRRKPARKRERGRGRGRLVLPKKDQKSTTTTTTTTTTEKPVEDDEYDYEEEETNK